MRVGDTLLRVNGQPCADPTQTAAMLRAAEGQLTLDLLRAPPPPPPPPPPMSPTTGGGGVGGGGSSGERRFSATRRLSASGIGIGRPRMSSSAMGGSGPGATIGQAATQLMLRLQAQLQELADEAAGEELRDNGGGEHGGAQAIAALEGCNAMIGDWQQQLQALLAANSVHSGTI